MSPCNRVVARKHLEREISNNSLFGYKFQGLNLLITSHLYSRRIVKIYTCLLKVSCAEGKLHDQNNNTPVDFLLFGLK